MEIQVNNHLTSPSSSFKIVVNDRDTVFDLKQIVQKSALKSNASPNKKLPPINSIYLSYITKEGKEIKLDALNKPLVTYESFREGIVINAAYSGIQLPKYVSDIIQYIFPFIYILLLFYKTDEIYQPKNLTQRLCMLMSTTHFFIKIFSIFFVKEQKTETISAGTVVLYCFLYWILYGIVIGNEIFSKDFVEPNWSPIRYVFALVFFICEYFCFFYRVMADATQRETSGMFRYVYCPQNFFEIIVWVSFTIFCGNGAMIIFTFGITIILINQSLNVKDEIVSKKRVLMHRIAQEKYAVIPFLI